MSGYRERVVEFVRANARPIDKFSHQERLYALAVGLADGRAYDDEVVFAAAWLHDLGVFVGHRPEDPALLATWDHIVYAVDKIPGLLKQLGFPERKIPAVVEVVQTHMPHHEPKSFEGLLVRDADILEQLGAVGILRNVSKIGRDTRFEVFEQAVVLLRNNLRCLPSQLRLPRAKQLAQARVEVLGAFLAAAAAELQLQGP